MEFEPVLNVPAFGTFLFITVVFSLLSLRTSLVQNAVEERQKTLVHLRDIKCKELSGESSTEEVRRALQNFEDAMQKEEDLRFIVPGIVRIVPPSAGNAAEKDAISAAKQFLGKEFDIGTNSADENNRMSPVAIAILVFLLLFQFALLLFLNLDSVGYNVL